MTQLTNLDKGKKISKTENLTKYQLCKFFAGIFDSGSVYIRLRILRPAYSSLPSKTATESVVLSA